jgi:hypothetical protein
VRLDVSLQTADLVLQPTAGPLEGIVERKMKIGVALVEMWSASNIDFFPGRKRQSDVDLVKASAEVARAWRLQHDPAGGDAPKAILEGCNPRGNGSAQCFGRLHPLKVDLNGVLHEHVLQEAAVDRSMMVGAADPAAARLHPIPPAADRPDALQRRD